jgi:hypothetical protein
MRLQSLMWSLGVAEELDKQTEKEKSNLFKIYYGLVHCHRFV